MTLYEWSLKWGLSPNAYVDLLQSLGAVPLPSAGKIPEGLDEATVQKRIRLEASQKGCRLWRNNTGVAVGEDGRHVRYGLANESAAVNKNVKSSDLIGIKPRLITESDVGSTIGQFVAREVKKEGWVYTGTLREIAQQKFLLLVSSFGGDACFATKEGSL